MKIYLVCAGTPNGDILVVDRYLNETEAKVRVAQLDDGSLEAAFVALNIDEVWVEEQDVVDSSVSVS